MLQTQWTTPETVKSLTAVVGIGIGFYQLHRLNKQMEGNHLVELRKTSFQLIQHHQEYLEHFDNVRVLVAKARAVPANAAMSEADLRLQLYNADPDFAKHWKAVANHFEHLSSALKHGACEERVLYDVLRFVFTSFYKDGLAIIRELRSKNSNPKIYELFEMYFTRWESIHEALKRAADDAAREAAWTAPLPHPYRNQKTGRWWQFWKEKPGERSPGSDLKS